MLGRLTIGLNDPKSVVGGGSRNSGFLYCELGEVEGREHRLFAFFFFKALALICAKFGDRSGFSKRSKIWFSVSEHQRFSLRGKGTPSTQAPNTPTARIGRNQPPLPNIYARQGTVSPNPEPAPAKNLPSPIFCWLL